jgi:hypothetical protein
MAAFIALGADLGNYAAPGYVLSAPLCATAARSTMTCGHPDRGFTYTAT